AMASVTLLDIDETAGTYTLKGPYAEVVDFESPFNGLFTQNTSAFNFNRNDDAFEAVNVYYHIDHSMRYINETLGISLTPYQYVGGVRYDPHGLGGSDNSYYSGGSGSLAFGEGCVDDAEDADVVIHELGHGVHDWITGGNSSSSEGLGEGSGDYWGQSYNRSLNQWTSADPEYQWFFNWDGHNSCWNGRITNYTATYPGGLGSGIHADGQIWATSLMRIYDQIGRTKTDKAFLEGLAMTGGSSGQQDAAIAVRQAAIDMSYSCADIDVFTIEFTATGYVLPPYTCSTVGITELTKDNVEIYPNPTKNILNIVLPESNVISKINIIDNLGRVVYSSSTNDKKTQISLDNLSRGIYTLIIMTEDEVISKKVVKD
ncbi:T9SS type A sorting domain-containing protein, partial [Vicingaceae bacterium]|nr:T9SS type A sorting domain-containing protein [Vicingaceae bacterium]